MSGPRTTVGATVGSPVSAAAGSKVKTREWREANRERYKLFERA
jgi:hypothetical protein